MVMNEVIQWLVLGIVVACFLRLAILHNRFVEKSEEVYQSLNNRVNMVTELHNNNSKIFAEEIAELQEELEIKNDEQIH